MSIKKSEKRGLALGAIFGLIASLFGAIPSVAATSSTAFTFTPMGGTSFSTLVDEDFYLVVQRDSSVVSSTDFGTLRYEITTNRVNGTTYSLAVVAGTATGAISTQPLSGAGVSASAALGDNLAASGDYTNQDIIYAGVTQSSNTRITGPMSAVPGYATQSYVVQPASFSATANNYLGLQFIPWDGVAAPTSESAALSVTVKAFADLNANQIWDSNEPYGTQVISFVKYSSVTRTLSLGALEVNDVSVPVSLGVSGVNVEQLGGQWAVRVNQYAPAGQVAGTSFSGVAEQAFTFSAPATYSRSYAIAAAQAGHTVSAQVAYVKSGKTVFTGKGQDQSYLANAASLSDVIYWAAAGSVTVASTGSNDITTYAVAGDDVMPIGGWSGGDATNYFEVRANKTYTIQLTASGVASSSAVTATFTFNNPTLDSTKYYSVNGGAAVITGTHSAVTATVNATTGLASITVTTAGFNTSDALTISAKVSGLAVRAITLKPVDLTYAVYPTATDVATAPASAVSVGASVLDQFGVKSALTTQRIKFAWTSGYGGSATNSFVTLSGGDASTTMTPSRTPVTGSAQITATLQDYSAGLANWSNTGGVTARTISVTVTDATNAFRNGLASSYSVSISYGAVFSWSAAVGAPYVLVTGSPVVVSGTGLIFKDANGATSSDTLTIPGNANGAVTFYVTGRTAGSFPITLTSGAASTTSLIVVQPAWSDEGASIVWDTTAIQAGKTRIVTGTLVDANGNPVDTTALGQTAGDTGTASLVVTYTGTAGVPVGTMPTETDADGKFKISILTSAADSGTFTLTAVYSPQGANTAAKDKVTSVQAITVGETAAAAADTKVNAGSFKGYVAIYAKGYEGQRLSAKVGNDWVVVASLASNFERVVEYTGAGYTIAVRIYIDRVLVDTITVTTK